MGFVLHIRQKKELIELFTDFETKNQYEILDDKGKTFGYAAEEGNSAARFFLKAMRPLDLHITDSKGREQLIIHKRFAFFRPEYDVMTGNQVFAKIKTRFRISRGRFDVFDSKGNWIYRCESKFTHWWTFNVFKVSDNIVLDQEVSTITKKWSGFGTEAFTEADTFHVDFGSVTGKDRNIILALAFAVDLSYFEKSG